MINTNSKTRTDAELSEDGMRLRLAMPASPYRMPHNKGGHLVLMGYEGDSNNSSDGSSSASCGCGACHTGTKKTTTDSSGHCQTKLVERFEIVHYTGYEPDGVTLMLDKRGVEGTLQQSWPTGTIVLQTMTGADYAELEARISTLEAYH